MESNCFPYREPLWNDQVGSSFDRIASCDSKVLTGSFGTILHHQVTGAGFTLRHYHCFITQAAEIPCLEMEANPFICVNLKRTVCFDFDNGEPYPFYEWAGNIMYQPASRGNVVFRKEGDYAFFTIHFSLAYMQEHLSLHPFGASFMQLAWQQCTAVLTPGNTPATKPMRHTISDMLYCDYAGAYATAWLDIKCKELLLAFFVSHGGHSGVWPSLNEREAEAIYRVKEKLLAELHVPHMLDDLACFAHLSEYKLKTGFKQIYGLSLFDFLQEARMKKAYELVADTTLPYYEIALRIGYQSVTTFHNLFKRVVGVSPKRLRDGVQGKNNRR